MKDDAASVADRRHAHRYLWVDVSRGIGIILVVWGHVLRGNFDLSTTSWARHSDRWIYAFHMPLFFLLAGLFLYPAIARGRVRFLRSRWWPIVWPYLLWSIVIGLVEVATARFVNSPIAVSDIVMIPIIPIEQFWFLYVLLMCQLVVLATWPSLIGLGAAVAAGLFLLTIVGGEWIGIRSFQYLPYVATGVGAASALHRMADAPAIRQSILTLSGCAAFFVALIVFRDIHFPFLDQLVPGFAGITACIGAAMLIARTHGRVSLLLGYVGQASLAIFVLHTLFSAGMRIALKLADVAPDTAINAGLSFVAGLLFPLLAYKFATDRGLGQILGFGGAPRQSVVGRPAGVAA